MVLDYKPSVKLMSLQPKSSAIMYKMWGRLAATDTHSTVYSAHNSMDPQLE